jgi:hypothetical protein
VELHDPTPLLNTNWAFISARALSATTVHHHRFSSPHPTKIKASIAGNATDAACAALNPCVPIARARQNFVRFSA